MPLYAQCLTATFTLKLMLAFADPYQRQFCCYYAGELGSTQCHNNSNNLCQLLLSLLYLFHILCFGLCIGNRCTWEQMWVAMRPQSQKLL